MLMPGARCTVGCLPLMSSVEILSDFFVAPPSSTPRPPPRRPRKHQTASSSSDASRTATTRAMSQSQESQWFGPSQDESQCDEDVTNTFKALPAHSAFVRLSQDSSFNDAAPTPADASGVTRITASASSSERGSAVDAAPREAPAATPRPAVAPPPPRAAATVCRPVAAPPADEPVPVCYACRVATAPDLDDEGRQRVKPPSAKDVREKAPERLLWRCPQCEKTWRPGAPPTARPRRGRDASR